MDEYFFDTYALVELSRANHRYVPYLTSQVTLTIFNLAEFAYALMKDYGEDKVTAVIKRFEECAVGVDTSILIEAMRFKHQHSKQKLSYADCIGYIVAQQKRIKFLTGDEQFKTLPNVEFVKG